MDYAKLKHDSVTLDHLQPDIRRILKGYARVTQVEQVQQGVTEQDILITLGQTVATGNALYPASDGKYYKAGNKPPTHAAVLFAMQAGSLNEQIYATKTKRVTCTGAAFTIGSRVWLRMATLAINVTTVIEAIVAGDIVQCVGWADSAETFIPDIKHELIYFN